MDHLGQRIIRDRETIVTKRAQADSYLLTAARLRREADEIERLLEQARIERPVVTGLPNNRIPGHNSKGEYSTAQMLHDEIFGGDTTQPLFD